MVGKVNKNNQFVESLSLEWSNSYCWERKRERPSLFYCHLPHFPLLLLLLLFYLGRHQIRWFMLCDFIYRSFMCIFVCFTRLGYRIERKKEISCWYYFLSLSSLSNINTDTCEIEDKLSNFLYFWSWSL